MEKALFLSNETLRVRISSKGAELQSILHQNGYEYLWQAEPAIWPRHAPVLFPIVGRLRQNQYEHEGKTFNLGQHGFARDIEFGTRIHTEQQYLGELRDSATTRALYPFPFNLAIGYSLEGSALVCEHRVENPGKKDLWFSLGAHPGFTLAPPTPLFQPTLSFRQNSLNISRLREGLLSGEQQNLALTDRQLKLEAELFRNDALVMEGGQIEWLRLEQSPEGRGLEMSCSGWPRNKLKMRIQ